MDHVKWISTLIMLIGEWKSVMLSQLEGFVDFALSATEFLQAKHEVFCLHLSKPWEIYTLP